MKAAVYRSYGPPEVLKVEEIEKPIPTENRVLVKVHAASINAGDYRVRKTDPFFIRFMGDGLLRPKDPRIGSDVAGVVEAVGENVTRFKPGDEVFGCAHGSMAEYSLARESYLVMKPDTKTFEEAAAVPVGALTALQGFRYAGGINPGQKVLIQGASGSVGAFAVQLAKTLGAEVTAVCSAKNQNLARSLGANHVIDYAREDFTRSGQKYDIILGVNGYHSITAYKRALTQRGVYVCAGGEMRQFFQAMLLASVMSEKGGRKLGSMGIAKVNVEDLTTLAEYLRIGTISPFIDRIYSLSEIVEAFRYVEENHAQGKVIIKVIN